MEGFGAVGLVEVFGEDQPQAVVPRGFQVVAEHEDDPVADVDGVTAEHGTHFGVERGEGFKDEGVWDGFAFAGSFGHEALSRDSADGNITASESRGEDCIRLAPRFTRGSYWLKGALR